MSAILGPVLDQQRLRDCIANDLADAVRDGQPVFLIEGARHTQAEMLDINWADDELCEWLRGAEAGDAFCALHSAYELFVEAV